MSGTFWHTVGTGRHGMGTDLGRADYAAATRPGQPVSYTHLDVYKRQADMKDVYELLFVLLTSGCASMPTPSRAVGRGRSVAGG